MVFPRIPALVRAAVLLVAPLPVAAGEFAGPANLSSQLVSDPLLHRNFLSLPVPAFEPAALDTANLPEGTFPNQRVGLLRLRSELDGRRIEHLWRLRSTNVTVIDFTVGYRLPGRAVTSEFFDPLWYFGPESACWILHGPGTVQRRDAYFPEFGRNHPAAFFRPPGTLPGELLNPSASSSDRGGSGQPAFRLEPEFFGRSSAATPTLRSDSRLASGNGRDWVVSDRDRSERRAER